MPKIVDQEQYRKELLHKSFDLLAEKGYANVTTRQLAKELGISTGAMYHYFPSKKALYEQLVEEIGHQDVLALQQILANLDTWPEQIAALGKFLVDRQDYFVKQTALWTDFCMHSDPTELSCNIVFQRVDERYRQMIGTSLGIDRPQVTQFVWTMVNGVLLEQVMGNHQQADFAEQVNLLVNMLVAYFEKFPHLISPKT